MTTDSATAAINPARINSFANVSNLMLADEMGDIDRAIDGLQARQKAAREEMTRRKRNSIEGVRFIIVKAETLQHRFNSDAVRKEMGDEWYESRQKPGTRTTYTAIEKPKVSEDEEPQSAARAAAEALFKGRG